MAKTKERQASTLTLAARPRQADSLVLKALAASSPANSPARLEPGLAGTLAEGLAAPPAECLGRLLSIIEVARLIKNSKPNGGSSRNSSGLGNCSRPDTKCRY